MDCSTSLLISKNSLKELEELNMIDSPKCLEELICRKQISILAKSEIASTCADDAISTNSSLSLSPKHRSTRRKSSKKALTRNFTLKEIATKRKYIKRVNPTLELAEAPAKKVKKAAEEQNVKTETQTDSDMMMLVWEDGKAKIVNLQEQQIVTGETPKAQKYTTSQSFKKHNHTHQWSSAETTKFFRALEIFGTDFSMIAMVFPQRNRLQIKNKFIKEEKLDFENVNQKLSKSTKNEKSRLKIFSKANLLQENLSLNEQLGRTETSTLSRRQRADSISSICSTNELDQEIIQDIQSYLSCPK
eukprot:CAMPEP_0176455260 /NCGR_PEP_ID=MMETSP0127-20121128/30506_1 /TAXON_ID=938130 /ORGANISM="Platyophrya macrostoma, Strain WH" /LENGTH=302 /DNA_ID=CAMNT_0017844833 /DNA_START=61 /DNA_END=969 /DNA_ORIENTATION=+